MNTLKCFSGSHSLFRSFLTGISFLNHVQANSGAKNYLLSVILLLIYSFVFSIEYFLMTSSFSSVFIFMTTPHRFSDPGADEREREDHQRPTGLSVPEERGREAVFSLFQTSHHLYPRLWRETPHHQGTLGSHRCGDCRSSTVKSYRSHHT